MKGRQWMKRRMMGVLREQAKEAEEAEEVEKAEEAEEAEGRGS